jgi:hypothetical protein
MSYKFKGNKVIINGVEQHIVPGPLPSSPVDGYFAIDESDGLLKVYNETKSRWISLGDAEDIFFDNTNAQLEDNPDNIQDAIEKVKGFRVQPLQYQYIGQMNYDQYLYSNSHQSSSRRSGDSSNGYRYGNSAPLTVLYDGKVVSASASITGIAQSTGSPASNLELKFELWNVGFNGEGVKLGDILFDIDSSQYNIGDYWNSSILTSFAENQLQDVNVSAGDLLALKYIRQTGNDKVVAVTNATIVLEIEGNS